MNNLKEQLYLAALLHDIGKFFQRADDSSYIKESKFLKEYRDKESTFCPVVDGEFTHKYVLWTAQFISDFSSVFRQLINDNEGNCSDIIKLASVIHKDTNELSELELILKEADCLAYGKEIDNENEGEGPLDRRMVSILETIGCNKKDSWKSIPHSRLKLSKEVFPTSKIDSEQSYVELWNDFIAEFKFIQANTYKAFAETFLSLLLKYTSYIPSNVTDFCDVSLYDHSKSTAALAVCLLEHKQKGNANENPFLLIGADFSGIQAYIYQIVSKYAGKNLKGRSFYLRLVSDTVVRYLLKELDLYQANIVYNSGGGFYILAPNTQTTIDKLAEARKHIEEQLFKIHGISLFVAIDYVELSKDALKHKNGENLGTVWGNLFKKRDKLKSNKFKDLIGSDYSAFFNPLKQGGDAKRDTITGEEFLASEKPVKVGDLLLKKVNEQQIKIGGKLRQTDVIVIKEGESLSFWKDKECIEPLELGFHYYFLNESDIKDKKESLKQLAEKVQVVTMNGKNGDCDFLHSKESLNNIYSLDFYGGNEVDKSNVPTFEDMCNNENFSRMGVLRMDVDNLGSIFQSGIAPNKATLSRFAALSRCFDFFFSGYLNTIWRETDPERSFIIYSGGDDVFIVGSWDVTIQLAKKISSDFKLFACNNSAFSLSGGIAIISPKYPIMKGAEESDSEEKNAKNHKCGTHMKDSISFMETPLNLAFEFPIVERLKDQILELVLKNDMPKSFISKILMHHANANIVDHDIKNFKTYWMMTYDLTRMKSRSSSTTSQLIDNCINEICKNNNTLNGEPITTNYHPLELWAFASRWAELEYRTIK